MTALILLALWGVPGRAGVLNVNQKNQEYDQWCWAGCSQAVLEFYGLILTQTNIAEYGTSGYNTWNYLYGSDSVAPYYRKGINMILNNWGLTCTNGEYVMSQVEVQDQIDLLRPVVVRWGWYSGGGHFVVLHGIESNTCYLMDPWPESGPTIASYDWVVDDGVHWWTHSLELTTESVATNDTPRWWLGLHGLTNGWDWDAEALADHDGDMMVSWQEYIAGTAPTNAEDVLKMISLEESAPTNMVLQWNSVTDRYYTVMQCPDLTTGTWDVVTSNISGLGSVNTFTVQVDNAETFFYMIGVEQ